VIPDEFIYEQVKHLATQLLIGILRLLPVYAHALHMGEPEGTAPTLQTPPTGIDERELAAIFTVQTAGEALKQPLSGAASWRSQVRGGDIPSPPTRNTSRWVLEGWRIHKVPRN
jgi:hypothetical protein